MKTTIRNVEIKSVAAWLPANKISLLSFCGSFPEKQVRDVIRSSGAEYVYRAEEGQKASDLCFNAAEHLIERDNIDRSSIDGLVFVSSTREWIIPDTAVSLQHRLGLSTETVCQDINYGCTGYIYGLLQASAWINCGMCRNILVLCSEVLTPYLDSHAVGSIETSEVATATLVAQGDSHMTIHLSSNGSKADRIMIPYNGYLYQDGMTVFTYGIVNAKSSILNVMELPGYNSDSKRLPSPVFFDSGTESPSSYYSKLHHTRSSSAHLHPCHTSDNNIPQSGEINHPVFVLLPVSHGIILQIYSFLLSVAQSSARIL